MKKRLLFVISCLVVLVMAVVFTVLYVRNEAPIYVYDYSGYYVMYYQTASTFFASISKWLSDIIYSIRNLDYNLSPIAALFPFYALFDNARVGYILGLAVFYVAPVIVLTILLLKSIFMKAKKVDYIFLIFIFFASFFYTRYWSPTVRGLPDIIGIIPILISFFMFRKYSFLDRQKWYIPVLLGLVVYAPFLFRRWYIYSIIGFYLSFFIVELIKYLKAKNKNGKIKNAFCNFFIAGVTTAIAALVCQTPLIMRIATENYSVSYSAFQRPFVYSFIDFTNEFGLLIVVGALIGFVWALFKKEHMYTSIFCFLYFLIASASFMTVQTMGLHHYLLISIPLLVLFCYGVYAIYSKIKNRYLSGAFLLLVISSILLNFASVYIFRNLDIPILTQKNKYYKFKYDNIDELNRLFSDMSDILSKENAKFSVLADTAILSDNLFDVMGNDVIKKSLVYTSHIDLRDGLNFNSLMCDYLVVTDLDHLQVGVNPDGQKVITVPSEAIANKTSIGLAYKLVSGPYNIDGGTKAYIYKKTRPFSQQEIDAYLDKFYLYYPDWEDKYKYFDIAFLLGDRTLGADVGDAKRYDDDTLYFSPGNTDTSFSFKINSKIKKVTLKPSIADIVDDIDGTAGIVSLTIKADNEIIFSGNIDSKYDELIKLNLNDKDNLEFIVSKGEHLNCDWLYVDVIKVEYK